MAPSPGATIMASAGEPEGLPPGKLRNVLIIVENLPLPFDRRVWLESCALRDAGYNVFVICPKMKGFTRTYERIENVHIYRHPLPYEAAHGALAFLIEYSTALLFEFLFALWIGIRHGFHVIHACNPPDTIFLIGRFFKLFGVKFLFDQHDINPELYIAKYGRTDFFYRLLLRLEKLTFRTADTVLSTNESYKHIALTRGGKKPEDVFIVRSAPDTSKFKPVAPNPALKQNRSFLVTYLGVMGKQEGLDLLLRSIHHIVYNLNRSDITYCLIGNGPEFDNLNSMAANLKIDQHVNFTGRIPDADLLEWLSTSDVCVNPDRVNAMNDKSTMNKILEYMAIGKPIVQYEITEGRYSAGEASLYAAPNDYVDFAEKIVTLIDDPNLRQQMGEFGKTRLEQKLDWSFSKKALLEAYSHLGTKR